ncbi:MAG: rSAM/selenodomain-associated transferase 1 [Cognaticolwellia sp.]|jgi:rSAM/selenodomain-associated transferase 1
MNHLLIFIKNPIKGEAKTRLAATVGDDEALRIYLELLKHTRSIGEKIDAHRNLFYAHFINNSDEWNNDDFDKQLQIDGDLGEKMAAGFQATFEKGATKAVIVGSDCASLTVDIVNDAFAKLETNDFVIGPADDGGYYLIGMTEFIPEVFQNITWSTEHVFPQTIEAINNQNKSCALLPMLSDIDYEEDWVKYGW